MSNGQKTSGEQKDKKVKNSTDSGVNKGVDTIGKITIETIKAIKNPVLQAVVAILGVMDILGLIVIVALVTQSVSYGAYSFGALLICNMVILIIMLLKHQNQVAMVRAEKKENDSNFPPNE